MRNLGTAYAATCLPENLCKKVFGKFWQRGGVSNAQGGERLSHVHGGKLRQSCTNKTDPSDTFQYCWEHLEGCEGGCILFSGVRLTTRQKSRPPTGLATPAIHRGEARPLPSFLHFRCLSL